MSEPMEKLKQAKEMLDMGLIEQSEYDAIKKDVMTSMGMVTTPPASSAPPQSNPFGGATNIAPEGMASQTIASFDLPFGDATNVSAEGRTIGQYRVLRLLGQGGMGAVYRARHQNENIAKRRGDVAIKLIHPHLLQKRSLRSRFEQEAGLGMSIEHPNVARVIDYVEEGDTVAFIMDFIEGTELRDTIVSGGLTIEEVVRYLKPIANALDYLHSKGIVHRDLKPGNIKIRKDGSPVILDFGIAKESKENEAHNMTRTGTAMGTEAYMAPEQMDAKYVDGKADQYALALMAYELLSGSLPWSEGTSSAMVTAYKMTGRLSPLKDVSNHRGGVSDAVMRGLSLEPENRFETCLSFVLSLEEGEKKITQQALEEASKNRTEEQRQEEDRQKGGFEPPEEKNSEARIREEEQKRYFDNLPNVTEIKREYIHRYTRTVKTGWFSSKEETIEERRHVSFPLQKIPSGSFMMGALPNDEDAIDVEHPRHKVTLTKSFWMSTYVCTQELYEAVMGTRPNFYTGSNLPIESVSWCDAVLFCNKLSEMEGLEPVYDVPNVLEQACKNHYWRTDDIIDELSKEVKWNESANGYRLPTESEWEYCARGGEEHLYAGSNNVDEVAWYSGNSGTHPVGQKKPNGYGLYDMSGNVMEWVWDSAVLDSDYNFTGESMYSASPKTDPSIDTSGPNRVSRGGCWNVVAESTRVSIRGRLKASYRNDFLGFRILRTIG